MNPDPYYPNAYEAFMRRMTMNAEYVQRRPSETGPSGRNIFTGAPEDNPTFKVDSDFFEDFDIDANSYTYRKPQGQPGYQDPNATNITNKKPRKGFIDAGVILKKGETISYMDFVNMPTDEWNELQNLVETLANIEVDEILERKVLWVYNTVPCITSMVA